MGQPDKQDRGYVVSASDTSDMTESVKEIRGTLGDAPIRVYQRLMAELRAALEAAKKK